MDALKLVIELLRMMAVSENNNARSIHNTAKEALKQGLTKNIRQCCEENE
jgi:hypothetical protein